MGIDKVKQTSFYTSEEIKKVEAKKTEKPNTVFTSNPMLKNVLPQERKSYKWNEQEQKAIDENTYNLQSVDKKTRKQAENNLIELFGKAKMYEKPNLSFKDFEKEVKLDIANAKARSKFLVTTTYRPDQKDEAKAAEKEFKAEKKNKTANHNEYHKTYNKKDYAVISSEENYGKFHNEDGTLSKEKAAQSLINVVGTDYRLTKNKGHNEEQSMAQDLQTSNGRGKSIAKTNNIETYNNANKIGYVAATTLTGGAAGAAIGYLTKATASSRATANATAEALDSTGTVIATGAASATAIASATVRGTLAGTGIGAALGLGYGLATMNKLGHSVARDDAAEINDLRYIDNTKKDCPEVPVTVIADETPPAKPTPEPVAETIAETVPEPIAETVAAPTVKEECKFEAKEETSESKPEPLYEYTLKYKESAYDVAAAKYGVTGKEAKDLARELKRRNGVPEDQLNKVVLPKGNKFTLDNVIKIGDKEYKLNKDAEVKGTVKEFKATRYSGTYVDKRTGETKTAYYYVDCDGNKSKVYTDKTQRDKDQAAAEKTKNAQ